MENLLIVDNVSKVWNGTSILEDIHLTIKEGERVSLFGPSGCGKSTLLRCIAGLEDVTNGKLVLNGIDITDIDAVKRPIVMMFQEPLLFPHMTVAENIGFGLRQKRIKKAIRTKEVLEMLEKVEMGSYANSLPHQLSGGQQQRIALARALIMNPSLLLLDEPFSSLDPQLRKSMRTWVCERLKEFNVTSIFVTHDKEEAMLLGDTLVIMKDGKIQQTGRPEDIYTTPNNYIVADLFSEGLVIEGTFTPIEKIKLLKNTKILPEGHSYYRVNVIGKLKKHGQTFYLINGDNFHGDIWIFSVEPFTIGESATIEIDPSFNVNLF